MSNKRYYLLIWIVSTILGVAIGLAYAEMADGHLRPWRHCHSLICKVKKHDDSDRNRSGARSRERSESRAPRLPLPSNSDRENEEHSDLNFYDKKRGEDGFGCAIDRIVYMIRHGVDKPRSLRGLRGCRLYATDAAYHRIRRMS